MAQEYYTLLTSAGLAYEAKCKAQKKPIRLSWMAVGDGDGAAYDPTPDQTQLRRETHRQPLNVLQQDKKNPTWYMAEALLPDDVGGWTIREVGIYTDTGILYAIGKYPESVKPLLPGGSTKQFYVKAIFQLSNAAEVTLIVDNNVVSATRSFVISYVAAEMDRRHMGALKLLDAEAAPLTFTLPKADPAQGVVDIIVRRTDNSGNRLKVESAGTDTIRFHTHLNPNGYPFLVLMGAGDWWHLRSDGNGSWWPIGRYDSTPLGRPVMETTIEFPPGGYGAPNGPSLLRAEWPWLWDHAQKSTMTVSEASRIGNDGGWTDGDGKLTFRAPEMRGELLRVLDESRGVDNGRLAGSWQDGTWIRTTAQEWTGSDISEGVFLIGTAFASADARINNGGPGGRLPPGALSPSGSTTFNPVVTDNTIRGTAAVDLIDPVNNWIRFRPRNIAYPARLKMI